MTKNIPQHIAMIMDGNGRWARRHGLSRSQGHHKGFLALKEIIKAAGDLGVKFLTVYAFSSENWKRPKEETDFLMKMCEDALSKELSSMIKDNIRFRHIGKIDGLSDTLQSYLRNAEQLTMNNNKLGFQLAFNYGSRLEITDAFKKMVSSVLEGKISISDINEETISDYLYTKGIPDPDLLIRTSGEMRVSNFLLWQICYSEIYVTKKFWPDFNKKELTRAIEDYHKRKRRFGGLDVQ